MSTINTNHIAEEIQKALANHINEMIPKHFGQNLHVFEKVHIHFLGTFIGIKAIHSLHIGLPINKWLEIKKSLFETQLNRMVSFYKIYFDPSEFESDFEPLNNYIVSFENMGLTEFWDKFESRKGIEILLMSKMYYEGFSSPIFEPQQYLFQKDQPFSFLFMQTRVLPSPELELELSNYDSNYCEKLINELNLEDKLIEFSQSAVNFANDILTQITETSIYLNILNRGFDNFRANLPTPMEVETSLKFMRQINTPPFNLEFMLMDFYEKVRRRHGVVMKNEADFNLLFNTYTAGSELKKFIEEIFTDKKVFDVVMNDPLLQTELSENRLFCWACFGTVIDLKRNDYFFKSHVSICQDCHKHILSKNR